MEVMDFVVAGLLGYLLGCFQTSVIVGFYVRRIDIRDHGSNNAGASNVTAVLGWKYGILTAVVDILKAFLAVMFSRWLFPDHSVLHFFAGAMAVLGHIFPAFLGFRGGKGTASLVGMALAIDPAIALPLVLVVIVFTVITDYIAIGSLLMYVLFPYLTYYFGYPPFCVVIALVLTCVGFFKHKVNIERMVGGNELGLRSVMAKKTKKVRDY